MTKISKKTITVLAMCIGIFLCMLDTTIMNIALPAMQNGLNIPLNSLSWALNVYTILFATLTIPIGKLAEILGRNKVYIIGLISFMIGAIFCGSANTLSFLILGRAVQSISAAIIFPASMTIGISTTTIQSRKKTIAALGVTQGLAAVLGPVIGGIVTQFAGWRWIFFINLPMIIIALTLCLLVLPLKNESKITEKIDWIGSLLSMITLFSLVLALIKGNDWGWNNIKIISLLISSFAGLLAFILTEKKVNNPMVDLKLFSNRQFNGAAVAIILSNLFLVGVNVILPTFFTKVENKTELIAALLITPISFMVFIFSPIAAVLIDKIGARIIIATGFLSMAISYFLLFNIDPNNLQELVPTCLLLGFGYGIIAGPITVLAASDFKGSLLTSSQSVSGVLRQIGITLAVAIFVSTLTGNITTQKNKSIVQAQQITSQMKVPVKYQQDTLTQAKKAIKTGSGESNSKQSQEKVIKKETNLVLTEKHLNQAPPTVKKLVSNQVATRVNKIFVSINQSAKQISEQTKSNMKLAYTDLYKGAFIFVLLSPLSALLFDKKNNKSTKNRA